MSYTPRAKRKYSQNFFTDADTLALCVDMMKLRPEDHVLEIGPGTGILTQLLIERVNRITAVEIDRDLLELLQLELGYANGLELIGADFMRWDLVSWCASVPLAQRKLVANIPYHLTSRILEKVLNQERLRHENVHPDLPLFTDIFLMVQNEVAQKLVALPGSKDYGVLNITVNLAAEAEVLAIIPRAFFQPRPKVDSAILHLRPRREPLVPIAHPETFWRLVTRIFQLRRKTLRNVLRALDLPAETLARAEAGWDLQLRGETLSIRELARLAELLNPSAPNA
jgi:16S rRNA (adenine1518-N6/adenine1519-N6)-dimethyltransferase